MKMLARHGIKLPHKRGHRIALGWGLIAGGIFGALPVLGFWMLPLGLAVLSVDLPWVRRKRRRLGVWWGRRNNNRRRNQASGPPADGPQG
jgi:hypothetical protein